MSRTLLENMQKNIQDSLHQYCNNSDCFSKGFFTIPKLEQVVEEQVNLPKAQCSKIGKKVQFQNCKNTLFAFSKMAKKSVFAQEESFKLPKMQF